MIICFQGTPGSGKSYDVVKKIHDNLKKGRVVYTNVDGMNDEDCRANLQHILGFDDYEMSRQLIWLESHQIKDFWNHCKDRSLIVIDEIQNFFSNRDWNSDANKGFCTWASTHRHNGYDLIMVTQHIERVDKAVVALVQWTYNYVKNDFMGAAFSNNYMVKVFSGDNVNGKPFAKHHHTYDKKFFKCYKSYVSADIKEQGIMKRVNIFKHPIFFIIPVVLCFTIYMIFFKSSLGTGDIFGNKKMQKASVQRVAVASVVKPVAPAGYVLPAPRVIEYKEFVKQLGSVDDNLHDKPLVRGQGSNGSLGDPAVSGAVPLCYTEAEILTEEGNIQIEVCGNKTRKRINDVLIGEKVSRGGVVNRNNVGG